MKGISGTFLDEITHDIPSQKWARDFNAMQAVGIDTVILIRAGYRDRATFDSEVLRKHRPMLPAYVDLVDLFLHEAERCGMTLFFGTYDSGQYWIDHKYREEVDLNKAFCDEVFERYGRRKAFGGWYISHEINTYDDGMMKVYLELSKHLRSLKKLPILISPYIKGVKQFGDEATSLDKHVKEWEAVFKRLKGHVDIVAFQDGHVSFQDLPHYLEANGALAKKYKIESWSNVETFDRDMPIKFPPIDFRTLRYKMEEAEKAGVDKLITFEFSHFMSPNSAYPAAHNLYERYRKWFEQARRRR